MGLSEASASLDTLTLPRFFILLAYLLLSSQRLSRSPEGTQEEVCPRWDGEEKGGLPSELELLVSRAGKANEGSQQETPLEEWGTGPL